MERATEETPSPDRSPELALQVARGNLEVQLSSLDTLSTQIGLVFGFASATLTAPAAFLALESVSATEWTTVFLSIGAAAYVVCGIFSYLASQVRDLSYGPDIRQLRTHSADTSRSDHELGWWIADVYTNAYADNLQHWVSKGKRTQHAMMAFGAETLFVAVGLIVAVAS